MQSNFVIEHASSGFKEWNRILEILHAAFAYQKDRINPPSSLYRLDENSLAEKATQEQLILAKIDEEIVGCVFVRPSRASVYIGKLAVAPSLQGNGIGRN